MLTYDEALLMLATLGASPDGKPGPQQQRAIERQLAAAIRRLGPDGQRVCMDLLREMLRGVGVEGTAASIRAALLAHRDRVEAVRLAASVAFGEAPLAKGEGEHLMRLALLMGLSEEEFAEALPQRGPRPSASEVPRLGQDQAILMLAVLAGSADGVPQDEEATLMAERLAGSLGSLGASGRSRSLAVLTDLIDAEGFDGALIAIRESLPEERRHEALRLAASVVFADGRVTRHEREHMARVARALRVRDDELAKVLPSQR